MTEVVPLEVYEHSGQKPAAPLDTISAASFEGQSKPIRRFLVPHLIPDRNVTILSGDGGTGKSLLALQLGMAVATGTKWLGMDTCHGSVLYFSAEDDEDETHIRLKEICEGEGIHLPASLRIAVMAGQDCILATENPKTNTMHCTPLYASLEATVRVHRPALLLLDNLADIYGGNENVKGLVRQFIGFLRHIAIEYECAVLVLAHPSLSGMSSGSGTSGNTAWNNSVRSRLYLKRQNDDPKEITDPDFRKLVSMKANYAPTGGEIGMRWEHGRFVATDTSAAAVGTVDRMAIKAKAERVFLFLAHRFNEEGRGISPAPSQNHAPHLFAKHPENEGVTKRQFEVAMDTLLAAGRIRIEIVGSPSRQRKNIRIVE